MSVYFLVVFFFFKQETAYEMRISDWSSDVCSSDLLVVRAGEAFAADAEIAEGHGSVDESMLTGESLPVERGPGEAVHAGTINRDGRIVARITATGAEPALSRSEEHPSELQ